MEFISDYFYNQQREVHIEEDHNFLKVLNLLYFQLFIIFQYYLILIHHEE